MKHEHPRSITDDIVEKQVQKGGKFRIAREQDSATQGPGGFDWVTRESCDNQTSIVVPRTDAIPPVEGPEAVIWKRKK